MTKQYNRCNFSIASFQSHHRLIFSIGTSRIKSHFYIAPFFCITHACTIKLLKISGINVKKMMHCMINDCVARLKPFTQSSMVNFSKEILIDKINVSHVQKFFNIHATLSFPQVIWWNEVFNKAEKFDERRDAVSIISRSITSFQKISRRMPFPGQTPAS